MIFMFRKSLVILLLLVIVMSCLHSNVNNSDSQQSSNSMIKPHFSISQSNLRLELFANKQYISVGDIINITYGVYGDNFTYQSGITITFVFGSSYFYKISQLNISFFTIIVNSTISKVTLQGQITSDQKSLVFFGSNQKPLCSSSCFQGNASVTQLQVFNNFSSLFDMLIETNQEFFTSTDLLQVTLSGLNTLIYSNFTYYQYYGNDQDYISHLYANLKFPILKPGNYNIQFSFYSNYYTSLKVSKSITLTSSAIAYSLTNTSVDRLNIGEQPKDFITYQFDFPINSLSYKYYISNTKNIVYSTTGIVSNVVLRLPITIAYYYNVGIYFLNLELSKNGQVLYSKLVQINVYDNIITELLFSNQMSDNQLTVKIQVNTYIEDTLVNIPSTVSIYDNNTNSLLKTLSVFGITYFNLTFSNQSIPKILRVQTLVNNSLYKTSTKYYPIYYRAVTSIKLNYENPIIVQRLQQVNFRVEVTNTEKNQSVIQGKVDLLIDSSTIQSINLSTTNTINYVVPIDYPVGKHSLELSYAGTNTLMPCSITYDYYVYSNVHFSDVSVNNTFTNPTTPILVKGLILDENNTGMITKISIIDNNNTIIDQTVSSSNGSFSFIILNTNIMGYYNYKLRAETVNYYRSAEYQFNLLQNNPFSVTIQANETMKMGEIKIEGDIYGDYQLSYFSQAGNDYPIETLKLDNQGFLQTNFLTPNVIGPIYFNVTNLKDPSQTWIQQLILYKKPTVTIIQLNDAYVGEKVNISITSDVFYRLFFNDMLLSNQYLYINKTMISIPVDTKGINTLKLVFQSQYITESQLTKEIFVYEQVQLLQNLPAKINENTNITTYLQTINNMNVPLGNLQIEFLYNGQVVQRGQTDNKGKLLMYITVNDDLSKYSFRILGNKELYINQEDYPVDAILIRTLMVTSDIALKDFTDLTETTVSFVVTYKNTGEPAPLVNMTIEIVNEQNQKDVRNVLTDNKGSLTIQINKPVGKYILTIITSDPNYIMAKAVFNFEVKGFDVLNNSLVIPVLFVSIGGILVVIRKKSI